MENSFPAWMHTIWTLGLNKGMCKCYMWELLLCWNVRLVRWTRSTAFMVLGELAALDCTYNEAWNISLHQEGMACLAYAKLNGMQKSNVCLFCDVWFQIVSLTSVVHAQYGSTPLLVAASNGHVKTTQLLIDKGANIEATIKVQLVANVY